MASSQMERSLDERLNITFSDSPGAKGTFAKSRSSRNGSDATSGKPRYSCATSAPAAVPVFARENETVAFDDGVTEPETDKPE